MGKHGLEMKVWLENDIITAQSNGQTVQIVVNGKMIEKGKWFSSEKVK